jgi:hypothetical protein
VTAGFTAALILPDWICFLALIIVCFMLSGHCYQEYILLFIIHLISITILCIISFSSLEISVSTIKKITKKDLIINIIIIVSSAIFFICSLVFLVLSDKSKNRKLHYVKKERGG